VNTASPIAGTDDDTLYQYQRYGMTYGNGYKFSIPNGVYTVTIKLAEIYPYVGIGGRVFNIFIEGSLVRSNVDVLATAGRYTAYDLTFSAVVNDGVLNVDFQPVVGQPSVAAIEVVQAAASLPPTPTSTPTIPAPAPTVVVEAESGVLQPYMTVGNDPTASGGQYIYNPGGPGPDTGTATYAVYIPYVPYTYNQYIIWLRAQAPDIDSNSIYLMVNNSPEEVLYVTPGTNWGWIRTANEYLLTEGVTHTLRLRTREYNFKVDAIVFLDRHDNDGPNW